MQKFARCRKSGKTKPELFLIRFKLNKLKKDVILGHRMSEYIYN